MTAVAPQEITPTTPLQPFTRTTINLLFYEAIDRFGPQEALRFKRGGLWQSLSYRETELRVAHVAALLHGWKLAPGDRVAILSENRPEWAVVDYATLALGMIVVPIYPSLPADQVAQILQDSGARALFVSTTAQFDKVAGIRKQCPALSQVMAFDPVAPESGAQSLANELTGDLETDAVWARELRKRAFGVAPESIATIIYTSGTTGTPKGAVLTHYNLAAMIAASRQHGSLATWPGAIALSLLPLSHVLERIGDYYYWDNGVTIAYAESVAAVPANLLEIRPNIMIAVPRLFDKVYGKVMATTGLKGVLVRWAAEVGGTMVDAWSAQRSPALGLKLRYRLADFLVFRKIRHSLGGRLSTMICGGAPLSPVVGRFFLGAGIPLYEGYGLTETAPVLAANRPSAWRLGSVGVPYPGVELRIGPEGEILARGPSVMQGYWNQPAATAAAIDPEGWFHTGDVGLFDSDGFLHVTDRIKDLIVTAGGKKVAPQPIEGLTQLSPYIAQAIMVGDRRPYPALLVVPDFERLRQWAEQHGITFTDREQLCREAPVRQLLEQETLGRLEDLAQFEKPKRIAILVEDMTIETGMLTPTFKVKRRMIEQRYHEAIQAMYAEAGDGAP
jgi:long-chain acyl-CoA synthetase